MTWEDFDNKIEYGKSEQWLIQGKKCNVVIKHNERTAEFRIRRKRHDYWICD